MTAVDMQVWSVTAMANAGVPWNHHHEGVLFVGTKLAEMDL
jgi:hypothetical protein